MISRGLKPGAAVIGLVASLLLLFATAPPASASSSLVVPLIRLTRSGFRVQSPVLDRLDAQLNVHETRRGEADTTDPSEYDLLIVDGNQHGREFYQDEPLLDRYTNAGDPVLLFDLNPRERDALGRYTDFEASSENEGPSEMFAFSVSMVDYTPTTRIIDSGPLDPSGAPVGDERRHDLRMSYARSLARSAGRLIEGQPPARPQQAAASTASATLTDRECSADCPELQNWHVEYHPPGSPKVLPDGYYTADTKKCNAWLSCPRPGTQTASFNMVHSFDVYLDEKNNRELIKWSLDGDFNPKQPGSQFFNMFGQSDHKPVISGNTGEVLERAWWTAYSTVDVQPSSNTDTRLTAVPRTVKPDTPNGEGSYTIGGSSIDVGVTVAKLDGGGGVGANYHHQFPSETKSIKDWGVERLGAANHFRWLFSSRRDCDVRSGHYLGATAHGAGGPCWKGGSENQTAGNVPKLPNELSRSDLDLFAEGQWNTNTLLKPNDPEVRFNLNTPVSVADTYCNGEFLTWLCPFNGGTLRMAAAGPAPLEAHFPAANVIPVGIQSLKVPDRLAGNTKQEGTGKVVLNRPAPLPVNVVIASDSPNAVVVQRVVKIAKGDDSGEFQIKTNANGLKPGESTNADITALYGGDSKVEQMDVTCCAPVVTTGAAKNVTKTSAKLNGTINPGGEPVEYWFRYGKPGFVRLETGNQFRNDTQHQPLPSGTSNVSVSGEASDLKPDTRYEYLLAAKNGAGTTLGPSGTFTTDR